MDIRTLPAIESRLDELDARMERLQAIADRDDSWGGLLDHERARLNQLLDDTNGEYLALVHHWRLLQS